VPVPLLLPPSHVSFLHLSLEHKNRPLLDGGRSVSRARLLVRSWPCRSRVRVARADLLSLSGPVYEPIYKQKRAGNFMIAGALTLFVAGVAVYTMHSVSQDDFSDVDAKGNLKRAT